MSNPEQDTRPWDVLYGEKLSCYEAPYQNLPRVTIEEIREYARKATQGPWWVGPRLHFDMFASVHGADGQLIVNLGDGGNGIEKQTANGFLICVFHDLLALYDQSQSEINSLKAFISWEASKGIVEVHHRGLFVSSFRCISCGFEAPNPAHYEDCRAVQARKLLGRPARLDDRFVNRQNYNDEDDEE